MRTPAQQKPWTVRRLIKELQRHPPRAKVLLADVPFFSSPGIPNDEVSSQPLGDVALCTAGRDGAGHYPRYGRVTIELHPA